MPQVTIIDLIAAAQAGTAVISFPTDTVPALASRPDRADLIFATKQRDRGKPLILMGASPADLWPYVQGGSAEQQLWEQVAAQYWPGPLTLVLPASSLVPAAMNPTDPTTIGIRVPHHELARQILAGTGPLATTSANRSGQPALETMAEIAAQFPQVLTPLEGELMPADRASGVPSTVVRWTGTGWEILRSGVIRTEELPYFQRNS
ncbi:hypothetical protein BST81_21055 [Leptolyngbya sp. 'hensonii']|uniref:L-threonylcarbamoyladenylate synthase n=1 Tax=Leptolyngbya sp. 'hensonii' TaxID=1922337 RepID=UPI00094FAEFD|nr:L-threonylcarbamoyladenylate synthase [Leptolyngbya sp. 'hensonii']OLP16469.1 hypothetical protein BST81_21055 [Leptolyngbya sp. 'hensonii']